MGLTAEELDPIVVGTGQAGKPLARGLAVGDFSSSSRRPLVEHERIELIEGLAEPLENLFAGLD